MFKPHFATCVCHNQKRLIVVKKGYCKEGNEAQKKAKKLADGKKPSKSFKSYSFKEPTGEAEMFEQVSKERPWICFICDKKLFQLTPSNFLHVLPKALNKFPKMKLYPKNIVLGCHDSESSCHNRWDKSPRSELTEPMWKKMFKLEVELLEEYKLL